jgi:hypothetical protein
MSTCRRHRVPLFHFLSELHKQQQKVSFLLSILDYIFKKGCLNSFQQVFFSWLLQAFQSYLKSQG